MSSFKNITAAFLDYAKRHDFFRKSGNMFSGGVKLDKKFWV